jgi:hypothetical protein
MRFLDEGASARTQEEADEESCDSSADNSKAAKGSRLDDKPPDDHGVNFAEVTAPCDGSVRLIVWIRKDRLGLLN